MFDHKLYYDAEEFDGVIATFEQIDKKLKFPPRVLKSMLFSWGIFHISNFRAGAWSEWFIDLELGVRLTRKSDGGHEFFITEKGYRYIVNKLQNDGLLKKENV